jgi:hypothetical protein
MTRFIRNTVILAKLETSEGSDPTPTGAANAILVSDVTITPLKANNVSRDLVRGYFGNSEQLVGTANVEVGFTVELGGSGTAATPTAWGPLLQACGFAQTIGASWVAYDPTTTFGASSSLTIYYHLDGVLHKLLGARGTFSMAMGMGERPVMKFTFTGKDGGVTAVANATPTLSAYRAPLVITDANTGDLTLGVTYATGANSGGTAYTSKGLQIDIGNSVQFQPLLGAESVILSNRLVSGKVSLDLSAAQVASFHTDVKANTTTTLGFTHGTSSGNIIVLYAPVVQRINPGVEDLNGQALSTYDLIVSPSAGNDEIKIITK